MPKGTKIRPAKAARLIGTASGAGAEFGPRAASEGMMGMVGNPEEGGVRIVVVARSLPLLVPVGATGGCPFAGTYVGRPGAGVADNLTSGNGMGVAEGSAQAKLLRPLRPGAHRNTMHSVIGTKPERSGERFVIDISG